MSFVDVPLTAPLTVGGTEITSVRLRRPMPGEMRGVRLVMLLAMDTGALLDVLPRITEPVLDQAVLSRMDIYDFGELSGQVVDFFQTPARKAAAPAPGLETETASPDGPTM